MGMQLVTAWMNYGLESATIQCLAHSKCLTHATIVAVGIVTVLKLAARRESLGVLKALGVRLMGTLVFSDP